MIEKECFILSGCYIDILFLISPEFVAMAAAAV